MAIEIFNRVEYKYVVNSAQYERILSLINQHMTVDEYNADGRLYTISNLYFDTDDHLYIRRSLDKPEYKEKLRLRAYGVPKPDDKVYFGFFTLAAGLACGIGLVGYAFLFTLILCAVAVMVHLVKFGKAGSLQRQVRITVPEDLHYKDLFDEIFKKYTCRAQLEMMRTRELGSVFELIYMVTLLKDADEKDFIDEIRCRNGNLNITMLASMELPKK